MRINQKRAHSSPLRREDPRRRARPQQWPQKIIHELEESENANYLLDRDRQRVVRWLDGDEDTQTNMSDVVFLSDAVTWKTIEDPSPTGVEEASSRQVEDEVKLNLETLEIAGYARSEGSIAGDVINEIEISTKGQCTETVIPTALLTSKAPRSNMDLRTETHNEQTMEHSRHPLRSSI